MAILADNMNPFYEKIFMAATVRRMTNEAIFFSRRMNPDEWSTFIDMAGKTEQVRAFCIDHSAGQGAMDVMAIIAFYLSLKDRVTGLLAHLGLNIPVAFEADRQLIRFLIAGVHVVAGGTLDIVFLVLTDIPVDHIFLLGMAFKTDSTHLVGAMAGFLTEGKNIDATTATLFYMQGTWTVAGFAGILGLGTFD